MRNEISGTKTRGYESERPKQALILKTRHNTYLMYDTTKKHNINQFYLSKNTSNYSVSSF